MATTILTSILGALLIAAIFATLKSRWLYVIAPRLYLNTPLSDGQIVTLTIINVGLLPEEDVALTLRPHCKFELIATSKSSLTVTGATLSIPKLARAESVNVILLIEEKSFDSAADIDSLDSKTSKGKVVDSKEKATAIWQSVIALPIVLLFLAVPFVFGTFIGSETGVSAFKYMSDKVELLGQSKQLAGYKNELTEKYPSMAGKLAGATKDRRIEIYIQEIVRRGDVVTVSVRISNNTSQVLISKLSIEGVAGGRNTLDYTDSRADSFVLATKESKTIQVKAFVPEASPVKLIQGSYAFQVPGGDSLDVAQMITLQG